MFINWKKNHISLIATNCPAKSKVNKILTYTLFVTNQIDEFFKVPFKNLNS